MYQIDHIIQLLHAYLKGELPAEQYQELEQLFKKYPQLHIKIKKLEDPRQLRKELQAYSEIQEKETGRREERILSNIIQRIGYPTKANPSIRRRRYGWYAVAACLIGLIGLVFWKMNSDKTGPANETAKLAAALLPGGNKATLQLADGTELGLDQQQGGIVMGENITYQDGSLALAAGGEDGRMMTLSTPKGGQYQIKLSDGTKVWLNADTRLRYPNKFAAERIVELDGEAYFEVTKVAGKPFIVATKKEKIKVLGTHFNVYSFAQEHESKVSLLEGKVQVSIPAGNTKTLHPGEQTVLSGENLLVQQVQVDEAIAWTNDEFMFSDEPLGTALTQVARWYDIEIEVDPVLAGIKLWGSVSRLDNFDKVLHVIKMTDDKIKVQIEGRRVKLMK
ncbi:FecR domain-containing protein [Sphingobacterium thalpophilum]|uniref:FecR domain-containing protein n=1 Tax=Sphingobacterium thalpophilum TaxID=259 RepID=UPI0037D9F539